MAHQLFSETDDWELENEDQDVRGYSVVDEQGHNLGIVRDMFVDTDSETIDRFVLEDGTEIDVASTSIEDGAIRVAGYGGSTAGHETTGVDTDSSVGATAGTAGLASGSADSTGDGAWRIRRHAEELRAQTQREQVGEVRVDKDVIEEEQTLNVPVTREEVDIRRVPANRPAGDTSIINDGDTIRIPVTAEQVEVHKDARVVEEVEIEKTARTGTERVSDTVRREEIDIEREGDASVVDVQRR
jgi:uncharacterized protein (TIGR02271 family)